MPERLPDIEYITLAVNRSMKSVAISQLAEMASKGIVEIIEPPRSEQFMPGMVEWLGPEGREVPVITSDTLKDFTSRTSSGTKAGTEIMNKIRLAARTDTDLRRYLYYDHDSGGQDASGILALSFDELLDRLGVDLFNIGNASLNVPGLGNQWFRVLRRYRAGLHPEQSDK